MTFWLLENSRNIFGLSERKYKLMFSKLEHMYVLINCNIIQLKKIRFKLISACNMKLLDDVTSKMRATIKRLATIGIIDKRERSEVMRGDVVRHDNQLLLLLLISCCPWRHPARRRLTNSCSPRGPWRWRHQHPQHSHGYSNSEVREGIRVFGEPWY